MKCPFCGVLSDVPHETEQACIKALNGEISRVRTLLERIGPQVKPGIATENAEMKQEIQSFHSPS
jgi:hypothetical protein